MIWIWYFYFVYDGVNNGVEFNDFGERGYLMVNILAKMLDFKVVWIIYWLFTLVLIWRFVSI